MDIRNRRALKEEARKQLSSAPNQKKIVALYMGASLAVSLVMVLVSTVLDTMISTTSGLSNLGNRVMLQTVQTALPIVQLVIMPFWDYGYIGAILGISNGRDAQPRELVSGFRIAGPILRLMVLQFGITLLLTFGSMYLCSTIFVLTPFSKPLTDVLMPLMENPAMDPVALSTDPAVAAALSATVIPMLVILLVIYCVLVFPILYLFRMAPYCLLEFPKYGARAALLNSRFLMRRNRWNLLKLDLSFWWYYLLMLIPTALCYGDTLLPLFGIQLPFGPTAAYLIFYVLYAVVQFIFTCSFQNHVEVTYANAFHALKPKPQPQPQPQSQENGVVLGNIFQM